MLKVERALYSQIMNLAKQSMGDPHACAQNMPDLVKWLTALEPRVNRSNDIAQRIITATVSTGVVVSGGVLSNNSNVVEVNFPTEGQVVGVKALVVNSDNSQIYDRYISVSIRVNGDRFLVTDGKTEKYVSLALLSGNPQDDREWFPLENAVKPSDRWFVEFSAILPGAGNATFYPTIAFLFEADM
jgi:hypothetical protein